MLMWHADVASPGRLQVNLEEEDRATIPNFMRWFDYLQVILPACLFSKPPKKTTRLSSVSFLFTGVVFRAQG